MGHKEHRRHSQQSVRCFLVTVSDTRTHGTDKSGQLVKSLLEEHHHELVEYRIIKDEPDAIQDILRSVPSSVEAIILTGGTGISKRDGTYEAVAGMLEKRLDGFGELFRSLSFGEIGSAAMLSRAVAGIYHGKAVFSLPGSESAVRLAMEKLILPELGHVAWELSK